jgi:hypothetical protein
MSKNLTEQEKRKLMSLDGPIGLGDVVSLKSGDTLMTVRDIDGDNITCEWQVKGVLKSHTFRAHSLEKAPKERVPFIHLTIGDQSRGGGEDSKMTPWERREQLARGK